MTLTSHRRVKGLRGEVLFSMYRRPAHTCCTGCENIGFYGRRTWPAWQLDARPEIDVERDFLRRSCPWGHSIWLPVHDRITPCNVSGPQVPHVRKILNVALHPEVSAFVKQCANIPCQSDQLACG